MSANNFLPFATGGGANVLSQAAYSGSPLLPIGQQPGIASSALNNKALRQASFVISQLAQYMVNKTGTDALDDGNAGAMLALIVAAFSAAPVVQVFTANGTFAVPVGATYLEIEMVGGGGGGTGSGVGATAGNGGNATASTFGAGASQLSAGGGEGGIFTVAGGLGGVATLGSVAAGLALSGASGVNGGLETASPFFLIGPAGAPSAFGGAGSSTSSQGGNAVPHTGGGGGGAGNRNIVDGFCGYSGGAGAYIKAILSGALNSTYAVVVGSAGAAGTAGVSGDPGGLGSTGVVKVTAYF